MNLKWPGTLLSDILITGDSWKGEGTGGSNLQAKCKNSQQQTIFLGEAYNRKKSFHQLLTFFKHPPKTNTKTPMPASSKTDRAASKCAAESCPKTSPQHLFLLQIDQIRLDLSNPSLPTISPLLQTNIKPYIQPHIQSCKCL